ncbi:MAG: hypothetical protein V1858_01180 [Candidatus Gottesmanbacteria bacterium]
MIANQQVAQLLRNIAAANIIKDERKYHFQIIAYEHAADTIEHATSDIKDLWEEQNLDSLPGLGKSIISHLDELFKTGKVKHFEEILKELPLSMYPLLSIPGFGPKKAYKLVKTLSLKNPKKVIDQLEIAAKNNKIAQIEGFGEKSQQDILASIQSYKKGQKKENRMNLPTASAIANEIISYLQQSKACLQIDPLGSLRRQVVTIGDIDISVATKNPKEVVDWFIKYPKKEKIIESGPTGASLLLTNGCQVDLRVQKPQSYGAMLQYFTGSKNHNIHLRELALKQGLSLSEYGITRSAPLGGARIATSAISGIKKINDQKSTIKEYATEDEFYQAIGLTWIPPELREDSGEIEASLRSAQGQSNGLPKLVELHDIKGDLHVHSNFPIEPSHDLGINSMDEIIKKSSQLRYEYIGFSEHSPSISKHTQDDIYNILKKRNDLIEQLKLTSKSVRVINLLEVDILADGNLSINNKSLSLLDGVIVSVHSSFNQAKEPMTYRILKALANPNVRILGHPTGRLLGKRDGYEVDWMNIFNYCFSHNIAIEINAWPERLDLPDTLVHQAIDYKVKLIISTDSHAVEHMDLMKYGVSVARRGWAKRDDILNTLSYNEFVNWLKKR